MAQLNWIGPATVVEQVLTAAGAEEDEHGHFIIIGPKAESLLNASDTIVVSPATMCICSGKKVSIVDLLPPWLERVSTILGST